MYVLVVNFKPSEDSQHRVVDILVTIDWSGDLGLIHCIVIVTAVHSKQGEKNKVTFSEGAEMRLHLTYCYEQSCAAPVI